MNKIDWSGELEAYHEDGRVVPVTLSIPDTDDDGDYVSNEEFRDGHLQTLYWTPEGLPSPSVGAQDMKWRIRNRQPATNDRLARLEAFVARVAESGPMMALGFYDEAKALVAEIAPVDPDLIEARKIAMDEYQPSAWNDEQWESRVMAGDEDEDRSVRSALAGIRRGRSLERGEP